MVPLCYLVAMAWILGVALINRPGPSLMALLTIAAGIPVYWLTIRGRRHVHIAGSGRSPQRDPS